MIRTVYCYGPQQRTVLHLLEPMVVPYGIRSVGTVMLRPIDDPYQLRGLEDVTFVDVVGMRPEVPSEMRETLAIIGAVIWKVDDTMLRARSTHRMEVA